MMVKKNICFLFLLMLVSVTTYSNELADVSVLNNSWYYATQKAENAVVQVFSAFAHFNWIEPYKTPLQNAGRGSGFFINDKGYIITNFHLVDQAVEVAISIPSHTKQMYLVDVISVCPKHDLALCCLTNESRALFLDVFKTINYVELGNSDEVARADDVLLLGYPLGEEILKSTVGVVSGLSYNGTAENAIQVDAASNPGNSGGPLLNKNGLVIGIENSHVKDAQNTTFAIPVNILKGILDGLYTNPFLEVPNFNIVTQPHNSHELCIYYGNPLPGGFLINKVIEGGLFDKAGFKEGDMIYEVNGYHVDRYGDVLLPWNKEKIALNIYISQLPLHSEVSVVVYRNGTPIHRTFHLELADYPCVKTEYPEYANIDYEVFGGMVIMSLTTNHISIMNKQIPSLARYLTPEYHNTKRLIITNVFPNSELAKNRTIYPGDTINEINGKKVQTLNDFRNALKESLKTRQVVINTMNEVTLINNVLTILSFEKSCEETTKLSKMYRYPL